MTRIISTLIAMLSAMAVSQPGLADTQTWSVEQAEDSAWHVRIGHVPTSLEEFRAMRDTIADTPQGGLAAYLVAHLIMVDEPEMGEQCLVLTLDMSELEREGALSRRPTVEGWQLGASERRKMATSGFSRARKYVAKSFVAGTTTDTGYQLPSLPYTYAIRAHRVQDADPDVWRGMAATSCTDAVWVPIHVRRNNRGIWKVSNSSSFYAGCKPPPLEIDDPL